MRMCWLGVALVVGCAKPCDPIAESPTAKRLGVVLAGGRVCKEDNMVVTIDYPSAKGEALAASYVAALSKSGWQAEMASESTILATKDADTLFVVTGRNSKDRHVPFAVVRYCDDPACRVKLQELAAAMKR